MHLTHGSLTRDLCEGMAHPDALSAGLRPAPRRCRPRKANCTTAAGGAVMATGWRDGAGRKSSRNRRGAAGSAAASRSHRKTLPAAALSSAVSPLVEAKEDSDAAANVLAYEVKA